MSSLAPRDWRLLSRSLFQWVIGLLFTSLAIYILSRLIDWQDLIRHLVSIPATTITLSILIYLVSMVVRALAWQFLLQRKVSALQTVFALNEGYFFNNFLLFRIGEFARAFLLGRRSRLGLLHVLSTIVVERIYDLAIAAGLLLTTLPLALEMAWAKPFAIFLLAIILTVLFALYLMAQNREQVEKLFESLASRSKLAARWGMPQFRSLLDGFSVFTRVEYFAGSLGLLASSWLLATLRDWLLIRSFVPDAPLWWAALGISSANIFGAIPSVMGALGTYELGGTGALTLVGMPGEAALAVVLFVHVTHLVFSTLIGAFALSREGQTLTSIYSDIRRSR